MRTTISLFLFSLFCCVFSQKGSNFSYAKSVVDSLASPSFHGRGYTHNGMDKSANWIADQIKNIGLRPIGDSFFQEFYFPVNIIEYAELAIDGRKLRFAHDFLVSPRSKSAKKENDSIKIYNFDFLVSAKKLSINHSYLEEIQNQLHDKSVFLLPPTRPIGKLYKSEVLNPQFSRRNSYNSQRQIQNLVPVILKQTSEKFTHSLSSYSDGILQIFIQDSINILEDSAISYDVKTRFEPNFKAKNVIGKIQGTQSDSCVVITAHYDHLGRVGDVYFPGANDNASGVAMVLSLAKYFTQNPPKYDVILIAFAGEEVGLKGSQHFVENPLIDLENIKILLNFDILGTGDDGIQVVNSTIFTQEYKLLKSINQRQGYLTQIKTRGEACNSDHCPFYQKGVPSFFIYTLGGVKHYHDVYDRYETLPFTKFSQVQSLFIDFIESL